VANLINAEIMVILTDQDGLFDSDPRSNKEAQLISSASAHDEFLMEVAGKGTALGRGGMHTKVSAAKLAARSGADTVIANGRIDDVLIKLITGDQIGTVLTADSEPITARKQWLAGQLTSKGSLILDAGAISVLKNSGTSLLAVGIKIVEGEFSRGDVVLCLDEERNEIARGLVNYSRVEVQKLLGHSSEKIIELLGYSGDEEIIHRDNLILS